METAELYFRGAEISAPESATDTALKLSFASEKPVLRKDKDGEYWEVLSHAPGDANFGFINRKGIVLQDHNERMEIGDVEKDSVKVDADMKTRGKITLFDINWQTRTKSEPSKIPISVGYVRLSVLSSKVGDDGKPVRRYSWSPYEISLLTVDAADGTVGINRAKVDLQQIADGLTTEERKTMKNLLLDKGEANGNGKAELTPAERSQIELGAVNSYRAKCDKILAQAELAAKGYKSEEVTRKFRALADEAIKKGTTPEAFNDELLAALPDVRKLDEKSADIGMDKKDVEGYSIMRAIRSCMENKGKLANDCPEYDINQQCEKQYEKRSGSFWIPNDVLNRGSDMSRADRDKMKRDLQVGVFGQGGAFVATMLETTPIEILRNSMQLKAAGMRVMGGLTSNVAIPRQTAAATAYSLGEIALLTLSTQAIDQIPLAPKRLGVTNNYSKQLLIQSSVDVENFMRSDMMEVLAIKADYLGINGSGGASEPTGIINTPGISSITFGAAATFAKLVSMETALGALNANRGTRAYITTPSVKGTLKSAAKFLTGGGTNVTNIALWEGDQINGYPALDTNNVLNNQMLFGNWNDFIMGLFGGVDVVVDPYSLAKNAEVAITTNMWLDFAVRHAQSFCVSADSAAQ